MTELPTWWRKLSGLVAACLVALLLAGPALDAVVCRDDGASHAVPAASAGAMNVTPVDSDSGDDSSSGPSVCVHGHCHHGLAFAAAAAEIAAVEAPASERHALLASTQHDSLSPSGLERPPRA